MIKISFIVCFFLVQFMWIEDKSCHGFIHPQHLAGCSHIHKLTCFAQGHAQFSNSGAKHQTLNKGSNVPKRRFPKPVQPRKLSDKEEKRRIIAHAHRQMLMEEEEEIKLKTRIDYSSEETRVLRREPQSSMLGRLKVGDCLKGQVHRIVQYGAWINIGILQNGFLHLSEMKREVSNHGNHAFITETTETLKPGQSIQVYVKYVDTSLNKLSLTCYQHITPPNVWIKGPKRVSASVYKEADEVWGQVVKITNYGAYIDIGATQTSFLHFKEFPPRQYVGAAKYIYV